MKKYELVKVLADKVETTQTQAEEFLKALVDTIDEVVVGKGEEINIPGLGKFKQKVNPAREGINPLNGQPLSVKESHTLKFTASASIKRIIEPSGRKGKK